MVESGLNDLILLVAGALFLSSLETRLKRRRCLRELHRLRSFAHVIDMTQLTKDPYRLDEAAVDTADSPVRDLSGYELGRYLDYCAEMLSLTAKVAAIYVERFPDPASIQAATEIETLTTGLARRIGQKIALL